MNRRMLFSIGLLLAVVPSVLYTQVSVLGELSQDREARPGERYEGVIVVKNDTDEPQEAKVYQTDYLFSYTGTNDYAEAGSHERSNARWVTFSPSYITLPPQGTIAVNFTVAVPSEAENKKLVGTYWSMLMVEGIPTGSPESSAKRNQMGILQTIRYGIQIATTIANSGARKIRFVDRKLVTNEKGERILQVDIENTGDLLMRPEMYVELFDERGTSLGKFRGASYRIYPGTSVRQSIDLTAIPKGSYKALVVVDAGGDDVFGAQYTLQL